MLSVEQNERVTRTGPESPAGRVLRHYWQPVALSEELDGQRPVVAVNVPVSYTHLTLPTKA